MNRIKVSGPPERPLVVWDGECAFCARWAARWQRRTGDAVAYAPHRVAAAEFPEVPADHFAKTLHFIETDGIVYTGAEAALRALAHAPDSRGRLVSLYRRSPAFARAAEWFYRRVASNRALLSRFS